MAFQKQLPPPQRYSDEPTWRGNSFDVGSRIVRAAWHLLETKEASAISLRELAHQVGVSAPAAYNHFKDRDQLIAELAAGGLGMLTTALVRVIPDKFDRIPKGLIPGLCWAWLEFAEDRPRHYALMFSGELDDKARYPHVYNCRAELKLMLRNVAIAEIGFDPPGHQADLFLAMLHGAALLGASEKPLVEPKLLAVSIGRMLAAAKRAKRRTS